MKVYRKPYTAEWYDNSAQLVAEVAVNVDPWTDTLKIEFDATKNKAGERHTTIRIVLNEEEVERLYSKLMQGRKSKLRNTQQELEEIRDVIETTFNVIEDHVWKLDSERDKTPADGAEEKYWENLRDPLRKLLDKLWDFT